MSIILIIDTIQPVCQLSIYNDSENVASVAGEPGSRTSLDITQKIQELLTTSAVNSKDLTAVGILICPVSITGAQVGQATAEALSLGLGIPLLKLDLLSAVKGSVPPECAENSIVLIKISDRHFAWAGISEQAQPCNTWRQGIFEIFEKELEIWSKDKNIYVSEQIQTEIFLSERFNNFKIMRLIMKDIYFKF